MMKRITFLCAFLTTSVLMAENGYWQQRVVYQIEIDFHAEKNQFDGKQSVYYQNNSGDTLSKMYFHLYFNAFQPGSMMDVRSRDIADPDGRVGDRILNLKEDEIGYHKIKSIKQRDDAVNYRVKGTILEVTLEKPLLPGEATVMNLEYESQVPVQIRRSGRNNAEGVQFSMSQWYPKVVEYDKDGWSLNPYIGREFHGVWGDYDVKITIDKSYLLGATGVLQNANTIGKGFEDRGYMLQLQQGDKNMWHYQAKKVHDFVWAADTAYMVETAQVENGPKLYFIHKNDSTSKEGKLSLNEKWKKLQPYAIRCFELMNKMYGKYPYEQYSIIQAGDGGMEYPMATLISGNGSMGGLISVTVHEAIHSWFQGLLATNEAKYAWMDEGFTSYAQQIVLDSLYHKNRENPIQKNYNSYYYLVESGKQEPLCTHADHFSTNRAYGIAAYSMGSIFLRQMTAIVGKENIDRGLRRFFNEWKFKHPTDDDFKRVMEKTSGIELDWYFDYWVHNTKTIDYAIKNVTSADKNTVIELSRLGEMPMPIDLEVELKDGKTLKYHIPLRIMYGNKIEKDSEVNLLEDWPWTYPEYAFEIDVKKENIVAVRIDPKGYLADVDQENNTYKSSKTFFGKILKRQ